jgi:tetratricopeptide (TPR) repeat protein
MRWASLLVLFLVCTPVGGLVTTSVAHAQTDASSDAEARRLYGEARTAFEAGDFDTAVRNFRRAYLLSPRFALLYNIGQAELRAGHDALALEAFEAFLRQAPADDEHRGEVEERARMLRSMGVQAATEAEAEQAQQQAGGRASDGGTSGSGTTGAEGTEGSATGTTGSGTEGSESSGTDRGTVGSGDRKSVV